MRRDAGVKGASGTGERIYQCFDGKFVKRIFISARSSEEWRSLFEVYQCIAGIGDTSFPPFLRPATLHFGEFEVAVVMDEVEGSSLTGDKLPEQHFASVARAVVWLARHGLVYWDVRNPNVMVGTEGGVVLVDYDDCRVNKCTRSEELLAAVNAVITDFRNNRVQVVGNWFSNDTFRVAVKEAFNDERT